jgi:Protein of unknown function (DUF4239)
LNTIETIPAAVRYRLAKLLAVAAVLYLILRVSGFHRFFINDAEGIGALLQIIGTLYSVLYAFAIYVIWGQFTSVENQIVSEAGSLKDLLLFSDGLKPATRDPIVRAVKTYSRSVAETEWKALSRGEDIEKTGRLFIDVISSVTGLVPEDETQPSVCERLLEIANQASVHRDERLALSAKRIPRTLMLFVSLTASLIFCLIFFYPFHNLFLGLASVAITLKLLFFAHFVLSDLDNPFEGTWNVSSRPFSDLVTKFR